MPKTAPKSLVESVQAVYDALVPFDEEARQRILQSATSLLGTALPAPSSSANAAVVRTAPLQSGASERPLAPMELIQQKKPATNPQRIALFAYYREKAEGLSRFEKDDLKGYFSKAKQPPPQNFDRDFGSAVRSGWIYEDGADSYLTSKGIEAVEAGFEGKAAPRGSAVSKGRRSPKKKRKKSSRR